MHPRIQHIAELWYLTEGALFQIFGTHDVDENSQMKCAFRCGRGKIEYNPQLVDNLDDKKLELYLKAEVIRILLKHPYDRQPDGCKRSSMSIGSNLVLSDNYDFTDIGLPKPEDYGLEKEESYEWYSFRVEEQQAGDKGQNQEQSADETNTNDTNTADNGNSDNANEEGLTGDENVELNSDQNYSNAFASDEVEIQLPDGTIMKLSSKGNKPAEAPSKDSKSTSNNDKGQSNESINSDEESVEELSQLWEEDAMMSCSIDAAIDNIEATNSWGSLAGNISEKIIANTKAKIDYRKVLSGFRASVLSTKRHLTRMRPNRRSGFDNMGSIRRFDTNVLIAVDVSGSISDLTLQHFFSIVNRAFKYGIEKVDVVQFDTKLSDVTPFEKAKKEISVVGRGGTNFQPIFDFVEKNPQYDGLIIFTDGYADHPRKPKRMTCKVVWVCDTLDNYEKNKSWMKETGRCCAIQI